MIQQKQGDYVAIEFHSTDASTAAAMTLKDADGVTRTLAAHERLLIDTLESRAVQNASDPSADIVVTVFVDLNADGTVDANERIQVYSGAGVLDGGIEGVAVKTGFTPKVKASGAGLVDINGVGRIIKGQTEGVRPSWREDRNASTLL